MGRQQKPHRHKTQGNPGREIRQCAQLLHTRGKNAECVFRQHLSRHTRGRVSSCSTPQRLHHGTPHKILMDYDHDFSDLLLHTLVKLCAYLVLHLPKLMACQCTSKKNLEMKSHYHLPSCTGRGEGMEKQALEPEKVK
jgi:hypothetical protein